MDNNFVSPNDLFCEFLSKQRDNIPDNYCYGKMNFTEMKRVHKHFKRQDIFGTECTKYDDLTSNYISITFRGKKVSLLRLLHHNFVGDIEKGDKINYHCSKKGNCCSINHHSFTKKIVDNNKDVECVSK